MRGISTSHLPLIWSYESCTELATPEHSWEVYFYATESNSKAEWNYNSMYKNILFLNTFSTFMFIFHKNIPMFWPVFWNLETRFCRMSLHHLQQTSQQRHGSPQTPICNHISVLISTKLLLKNMTTDPAQNSMAYELNDSAQCIISTENSTL